MMGMLNSLRRFFIPALSPAMFNVATIVSAFTLVPLMPRFGWPPIAGIAFGTLLGGLGQMAHAVAVAAARGLAVSAALDWRDPGLREVLMQMAPGTLGLAAMQVNVFINTMLATRSGHGRRVVAELRVSIDVSAHRSVRHLDRHRRAARNLAAGGRR